MKMNWLFSTIGKRGYIADYLREADPNVRIIGGGMTEFTPGFTACDQSVLVPAIHAENYLEKIRELVSEFDIHAILSFADPDVAKLAEIRDELSDQGIQCFFPNQATAKFGFDKFETAMWAERNDILTPKTYLDPQTALQEIGLPIMRKPRYGSASQGISVVRTENDLMPRSDDKTEYIYQEMIEGEEVNVEICSDLRGRPMGISAWKKMISRHGETELAVTVRRDDLIEYGRLLGEKAKIPGPCDVDIIERDGKFYLIEFNMRFGGGYPVSQLAGADFPKLISKVARGDSPPFSVPFKGDVFMMKTLQPFGGSIKDADMIFNSAKSICDT